MSDHDDGELLPDLPPLTAFPPQPGDPGHLLPEEDWQRVVREAEQEAERIRRGQPPREAPRLHGVGTGLALPLNGVVAAPSHGGVRGLPSFGVFHTMETPLSAGYAAAIARYFAGGPGTSCHYTVDPAETWGVLPDHLVAWHCGNGNPRSVALEMAGRASLTRAQWLAADGMAQHRRAAAMVRRAHDEYGIGMYLMTDQQLRDAHAGKIIGGWADHNRCRVVLGGTTHTDVGTGCPLDLILQLANEEDDDMFGDADRQMLMDVQRGLGVANAALTTSPIKVEDTILYRMRDLTAAIGSGGAVKMAAAGTLPPDATVLGLVRRLRDQLDELEQTLTEAAEA